MMTTSAFEILGPIMVGPSSSHTAGALRIALVARSLGPSPLARVTFTLYNSFSRTYRGHGTDRALVAGIMGLAPDDVRVRDSFDLARKRGLDFEFVPSDAGAGLHPNTVTISMEGADGTRMSVTGESLGGGRVRISSIDGIAVEITGDYPTLFVAHQDRPGVLAALTSGLSAGGVNIATMRTFRERQGGRTCAVFEVDGGLDQALLEYLRRAPNITLANIVNVPGAAQVSPDATLALGFDTGAQLLSLAEREGATIGEVMRRRQLELFPTQDADALMAHVLQVMREETTTPIERPLPSLGGLLGGQAKAVHDAAPRLAAALMGETLTRACAYAMAVLERSATMGVIVAAPTAGSAGVIPGAVLAVAESVGASDDQVARALWNACAIGSIVARNASVAGAEGGCQAEVGTASAMAAAAATQLLGGGARTCLDAASIAMGNLLGMVCDPVGGLVEDPCQKRNAAAAENALASARMALAGVRPSAPFDEVVEAMRRVGAALPAELRETALGGLAACPSCRGCAGR